MATTQGSSVEEYQQYLQIVYEIRRGGVTDVQSYLDKEKTECCSLHREVSQVEGEAGGCRDVPHGEHPAIQAFVKEKAIVCHAHAGQLALDRSLAVRMYNGDESFLKWAWSRDHRFRNKYMSGNFARVGLYGRGYCYLRGVEPTVRSRLARVFGSRCLIGDYLMQYMFFGFVKGNRLSIKKTGDKLYHVANSSNYSSFFSIANELLRLYREDPYIRVGADEFEGDHGMYAELVGAFEFAGPFELREGQFRPRVDLSGQFVLVLGVEESIRRDRMFRWFTGMGIFVPNVLLDHLMVVTSSVSLSGIPLGGRLKDYVRLLAVQGDLVMKQLALVKVMSRVGAPAAYAAALTAQTNDGLAAALLRHGFRHACCDLPYLSESSSANATVFGAVVGLLYSHRGSEVVAQFLVHMDLAVVGCDECPYVGFDDIGEGVVSLNSSQYERFMQMYNDGAFGR